MSTGSATNVAGTPIADPAAWRGPEVCDDSSWTHRLSEDEIADLDAALVKAKTAGKRLWLTARDFTSVEELLPGGIPPKEDNP
ncbi:MAG TPA: hypothetical protein VFO62_09465 [Candidatus Binatia bacterium]|nr:hypothetical protein [Candidatus Binatia bacterium]